MKIGIVGLGLIGGSFAKAYYAAGHQIFARDIDRSALDFAKISGEVCGELTKENAAECELILVCVYPSAATEFIKDFGPHFGENTIVIDCCGTKRSVCTPSEKISEQYGFVYMGGHPMAGTHFSGYKYARANLFHGAPMVLVPSDFNDIALLQRVKTLLEPAQFAKITVTTAQKHDEIIAFTSQLAHVVSSAYIKSPTAKEHKGFSAGSYKDMTRVAWLNPEMWAELFLDNGDYLLNELDYLTKSLDEYKAALKSGDKAALVRLLQEGKDRKEEVDGK